MKKNGEKNRSLPWSFFESSICQGSFGDFFSLDVSQVNPQVGRPVCYKPTLIRKLTSEITFSCVFRLVCFHVFF